MPNDGLGDHPAFFKRGTYLQRRAHERTFTEEERARIPEAHRPPPDALVTRHQVIELDLPPVRQIGNLAAVLFEAADPTPRPCANRRERSDRRAALLRLAQRERWSSTLSLT